MRCLVTSCTATVATGGWVSRGRGTRVVFHRESRGRRQRVLGELRMTVNYGGEKERAKLQALVYDIVPSTTAVFSYAIGSRKRAVFCWCSNSSKCVTNNSDYIRRLVYN